MAALLSFIRCFYGCPLLEYYPFLCLQIKSHESKIGQGLTARIEYNNGSNFLAGECRPAFWLDESGEHLKFSKLIVMPL